MRSTLWGNFALVCVAVLGLPCGLANASLRRTSKAHSRQPEVVDPEIAEAEALAAQAEAEALGGVADPPVGGSVDLLLGGSADNFVRDASPKVAPAAATATPRKAAKDGRDILSAAMHDGGINHWGTVVRAAVKSLAGNATKAAPHPKAKLPVHVRGPAKHSVKSESAGAVVDQHSAVRTAVRATVKEVLPGKETRKAIRKLKKLPAHVTKGVGKVATMSAPHAGRQKKKKPRAPQGGVTAATATTKEHRQDFSVVEPGIAYGHGQRAASVAADQQALDEARDLEEQEMKRRERELDEAETLGVAAKPSVGARQRRMLHEVEDLEEKITEETKSESLAYMLGSVKMDLHQLNEKMDMLQKDVSDGVPMDPAVIDETVVYPLSTCMMCIFLLSAQYFVLYTALAVCKAFVDIFELGPGCTAEKALRAACDTVFYAPMLCVLFLGAHLRSLQITLGRRGPQEWAETAMLVCTWSCLLQTLLVLAIPIFNGKQPKEDDRLPGTQSEDAGCAGFLTFMRYIALLGLYSGLAMVCVAVVLMDARSLGTKPPDIWDDPRTARTEYAPPVSVAMVCTIALTLFFFIIHLAHAVLWSCRELLRNRRGASSQQGSTPRAIVNAWEECLRCCTSAVNLAPVLCILFIAARMRALQMDPKWGRPQGWAESCFYICVGSLMVQTLLIVVAKILEGGSIIVPVSPRQRNAEEKSGSLERAVLGLSYLAMAITYVACGVVMYSVVVIKAKNKGSTPPLSPAMFCVMLLVTSHLVVYLFLFLAQAAVHASGQSSPVEAVSPRSRTDEKLRRMLDLGKMAENTVKLAPMLAVLFVAARMRALQMSNQKGSPQCWAQDAMYMATGAIVLQLGLVFASGLLSSTMEVDEDGMLVTTKIQYLPGRIFLECLKAIAFFMLFGGVIAVVASILMIRPETARCAIV